MSKKINLAILIDDEQIDQRIYTRVIERTGLVEQVLTFTYADEALTYLSDNTALEVDVIFLDINMPRMTGFEFLEAAHEQLGDGFAKIVVAMLTTSLDPEDQRRAASYEVVKEFINKPLTEAHVEHVASMLPAA